MNSHSGTESETDEEENDVYTLSNQFITLNTYIGIEINAHALLRLVARCIDKNSFDDLLP